MNEKLERIIKRHEIHMNIALQYAKLTTCIKRSVGAVLTKDNHILATAYNGQPPNFPHCTIEGCRRKNTESGKDLDNCNAIHAEMNVIGDCCRRGVSTANSTLYITTFPCINCLKAMISAKIRRIIFLEDYNDQNCKRFMASLVDIKDKDGLPLIETISYKNVINRENYDKNCNLIIGG